MYAGISYIYSSTLIFIKAMEMALPGYYGCNDSAVDIPTLYGALSRDGILLKDGRNAVYQENSKHLVEWNLANDNDSGYTNSIGCKICSIVKVVFILFFAFILMITVNVLQEKQPKMD